MKTKGIKGFLILIGTLFFLFACKPYGDSASDLGYANSNVVQSGLAGTWYSSGGNSLTILQDSTFSDSTCSQNGQVMYVSQQTKNCPAGSSSCGSLTFSNAPYNAVTGCSNTGQTVCSFFMSTSSAGSASLALACADANAKINFSYQAM
jgi:hypothetical protein